MNFGLAREIYGIQPWCVDQHTLPALISTLTNIQNGVVLEIPDEKYNFPFNVDLSSEGKIIRRPWQLNNRDDFRGIGIININGPITAHGGNSTIGMSQLAEMMLEMSQDERIIAFIVLANSGGGSSTAVEIMVDAILEVRKTREVYGLIKKGGLAASACYGILTACNAIYSESKMSIVGSAGTMMQFEGREANTKDKDGKKYIRLYAPAATHKNLGYEEALNNDNYEFLIDELLKPINQNFLSLIISNRPQLQDSKFDNGHTVFAGEAIGTFIDGIKSFKEVVEMALNVNTPGGQNSSINQNSRTMTVEELRQAHPSACRSIFNEGVAAEKDRIGAWLAHIGTNQETVLNGIKSNEPISSTQVQELLVEAVSKKGLKDLEDDSKGPVKTKETKPGQSASETEQEQEETKLSNMLSEHLKAV